MTLPKNIKPFFTVQTGVLEGEGTVGIGAGVRAEKRGFYAEGEALIGNELNGSIKVGKEFKINNHFSADIGAKSSYRKLFNLTQNSEVSATNTLPEIKGLDVTCFQEQLNSVNEQLGAINEKTTRSANISTTVNTPTGRETYNFDTSYGTDNPEFRAAFAPKLSYKNKGFKASIGTEIGYRSNDNYSYDFRVNNGNGNSYRHTAKSNGFYVTPTAEASYKKGIAEVSISGDIYGGQLKASFDLYKENKKN